MRIYDVNYAHRRYGERFSRVRVAVRGFAPEAMRKAAQLPDVKKWNGALRCESVELVASTQSR